MVSGNYAENGGPTALHAGTLEVSQQFQITGGQFKILGAARTATGGMQAGQVGALMGWGAITGNVTNAGLLAVGDVNGTGALAIAGHFTHAATGVTNLEIAALNDHDRLQVTGTMHRGGVVNVLLPDDYTPEENDAFAMLAYGDFDGQWVVNFPPLNDPNLTWDTLYNPEGAEFFVT